MKRCLWMLAVITALFPLVPSVFAADPDPPFAAQEALFDALEASAEAVFDDRAALLESLWERMEAEEEAKWQRLEAEVLQKWDRYHQSSQKEWVDYSPDRTAVSQVNFETGQVKIEVLVPAAAPPEEAQAAATRKLQGLVQEKDAGGAVILADMLPPEAANAIAAGKVPVSAAQPVKGQDGIQRRKVAVTLNMVPDHVQRRAEKFFPQVKAETEKSGVDPALVLAIIQSESAFNPQARSHIPAFGLMQIVPRYAGKEAYTYLYDKEKVLSPDYLYNPDNNIELGVTYLKLLDQRYFKDIEDADKRRYVVVCAYNWGPTAMRKRLLPKLQVEDLSQQELYAALLQGVPEETHNYLQRVEKRRLLYAGKTSAEP